MESQEHISSNATSSQSRDPGNKYGRADVNDKNIWYCNFCQKKLSGGVHRFKQHLAGGFRNASKCLKCPVEVRQEIILYMKEKAETKSSNQIMPDLSQYDNDECDEEEVDVESRLSIKRKRQTKGPMDMFITKKKAQGTSGKQAEINKKNREMFEPFIEDEVPFDEYCGSMEKDGTWAGHMELQAASLVTHSNICIHQSLLPRWYIRNFDDKTARMIHLSYHDGEHYNSVRSKEDPCDGAARSIIIKVDASLTAKSNQGKSAVPQSREIGTEHLIHSGCIKIVMSGSGCEDARKVEQELKQVDGDTDAAIEYLIAERGSQDVLAEDIKVDCQTEDAKNENSKPQKSLLDTPTTEDRGSEVRLKDCDSDKPSKNDKKIPRNKVCPCGSKKKYKSCCGAAAGRTSKFAVREEMDDLCKGKKGKKLGKKGAASSSNGSLVDLGALCI